MHVSIFRTNVFSPRSNWGNEKLILRVLLISNYIYNDIDVDDTTKSNNSAFDNVCQISVEIA